MELHELYKQLEKYKDYENNIDHLEPFLDTVDQIVLKQDPSSIPIILELFNDESNVDWVNTCLRKSIEHYPLDHYIVNLMKYLEIMLSKAPLEADEIFNSIFNDENDFKYFCSQVHLAKKDDLLRLLNVMEIQSPHHQEKIKLIRKIL